MTVKVKVFKFCITIILYSSNKLFMRKKKSLIVGGLGQMDYIYLNIY